VESVYTEQERFIFSYRDGGEERFADPMALWRAFRRAQRDLGVDYGELVREGRSLQDTDLSDDALAERMDRAIEQMADIGRAVFGKPKLAEDGSGWTDAEALANLDKFLIWQDDLQGKAGTSPSSSTSTAGPREASADEVALASITPIGAD
jgi:hypothetical protein